MKPITVGELIKALQGFNADILVGLSKDSEGNEFSLIPNEEFMEQCYTNGKLGSLDFDDVWASKDLEDGEEQIPTIMLYPSN